MWRKRKGRTAAQVRRDLMEAGHHGKGSRSAALIGAPIALTASSTGDFPISPGIPSAGLGASAVYISVEVRLWGGKRNGEVLGSTNTRIAANRWPGLIPVCAARSQARPSVKS